MQEIPIIGALFGMASTCQCLMSSIRYGGHTDGVIVCHINSRDVSHTKELILQEEEEYVFIQYRL